MPTALIGSGPIRNQPGRFREILAEDGFQILDPPGNGTLSEAETARWLPKVEAIITGAEVISEAMLAASPKLRVIARSGVGFDAIDVAAATRRGVVVTNAPGTNHEAVAEQAFALILALLRHVVRNDRAIHEGGWDWSLVEPLRGKTLGLVGLGRTGRAMVPRARAFGVTVLGFDPGPVTDRDDREGIRRVDLPTLLAESDLVSLHMPLLPETRRMFNRELFARMRPGSYLINTARGGVVDEADLVEALRSGHLAGAGLDVLDREPPDPSSPLLQLPNVVLTPHSAGADFQSMSDMAARAASCVVDLHHGRWPTDCVVNPELAPSWRWSVNIGGTVR